MQILNNKTIVFVGGGNMAGALIDGLLTQKSQAAFTVGVIDPEQAKLDEFAKKGVLTASSDNPQELLAQADVVVLAVKPQVMADVCADIKADLAGKLIISVAAGLSLNKLQTMTDSTRIVRTMPNLPATVGLGATGLYATVSDDNKALAQAVMSASGIGVWVDDERDLHTVTAVAGSAPAYFFYVLEQMIEKAVQMGLSYDNAHALAVQTMQGASVMAKTGEPSELRAKVTSKGGTTHAAITHFEENNAKALIFGAMQACYDRSVELGS